MKETAILTATSLLSILLTTFHLTDDIVFKISPGGLTNLTAVMYWVLWLYGTLVLAERRAGYIIVLVASLLALGVTILHLSGRGLVGGTIGASSEAFFFVWTVLTLAVTSTFAIVLSARALWSLPWRRRP